MKKLWIILLVLVLACSFCACSKVYTFPENTTVLGVDVANCSKEDAWARLEAAAGSYVLDLTVDEISLQISGADIGLGCSNEAFLAAAQAMEKGTDADFSSVVTFDEAKLKTLIQQNFQKEMVDATLVFDETAGVYQLTPHAEGLHTDPDAVVTALRKAKLLPESHSKSSSVVLNGGAESDEKKKANAGFILFALALLATFVTLTLVLMGII